VEEELELTNFGNSDVIISKSDFVSMIRAQHTFNENGLLPVTVLLILEDRTKLYPAQ
jgi:hypothetical protein